MTQDDPKSAAAGGDAEAVTLANEAFYRALSDKNLEAMERLWVHEEDVQCIHPGWEVLSGWSLVHQSWGVIFDNPGTLKVDPSEVVVRLHGTVAWVSCLESIRTGDDPDPALARATNLFVKSPGGWKMVLHHASQISAMSREEGNESTPEDDEEPTIH